MFALKLCRTFMAETVKVRQGRDWFSRQHARRTRERVERFNPILYDHQLRLTIQYSWSLGVKFWNQDYFHRFNCETVMMESFIISREAVEPQSHEENSIFIRFLNCEIQDLTKKLVPFYVCQWIMKKLETKIIVKYDVQWKLRKNINTNYARLC